MPGRGPESPGDDHQLVKIKPGCQGIEALLDLVGGADQRLFAQGRNGGLLGARVGVDPGLFGIDRRLGVGLIGTAALALGILALATQRFPLAVAALCCGAAGLINYNISWGMLGAALGSWTWLRAR